VLLKVLKLILEFVFAPVNIWSFLQAFRDKVGMVIVIGYG